MTQAKDLQGFIIIDKPSGVTSRDVVNRAQAELPRRTRIGHTGTLDPLATGALVLCVGTATRLAERVQAMTKVYTTKSVLGAVSDTDDADGTVTEHNVTAPPDRKAIEEALCAFVGQIQQTPPAYSAAKVTGKRAYALARKGEKVTLAPRTVRVDTIDLLSYDYPFLELKITCGKGTYIRSIVRDLGAKLGCGGYVKELRRLSIGNFHLDLAYSIDLEPLTNRSQWLPLSAAVADCPSLELTEAQIKPVLHGNPIAAPDIPQQVEHALLDGGGNLLAIAERREEMLVMTKVLASPNP